MGCFGKATWLNYIGRIAFPIFAYQITEGYIHTRSFKKYFFRLLLFALISQFPFALFYSIFSTTYALNVFFTLLLGLFCIYIWDKMPSKFISLPIIAIISLLAEATNMDYGYWGILVVFIFYLCKNNKFALLLSFIGMLVLKYLPNIITYNFYYKYILFFIFTLLSIIPILLYNGKQGRKIKYFLYVFYPVHLLLLYLLNCIL